MAIVQISRIQIRRGLNQDLPQLASAEMGWSLDTQQLYIGNGTTQEGAPSTGVTEILTQHSNLLNLIGLYTYQGLAGGYSVVTGLTSSNPITRTLQQKLDDSVNVRDFGVVGDGVTDDTLAINRAIQQIYSSVYLDSAVKVRRTLNFPAGTYLVSSTILIPPYAKLIGDGRDSTIITSSNASVPIFKTVDSQYNGTGLTKPRSVVIHDMQLASNAVSAVSLFQVDSLTNGKFVNMKFQGFTGSTNNLVFVTDSIANSRNVTFDNCSFQTAVSGINVVVQSSGVSSIRVNNSNFDYLNVGYSIGNTVNGFSSDKNYFGNVAVPRLFGTNGTHFVFADSMSNPTAANVTGIMLGRENIGGTVTNTVPTGAATTIAQLTTGAGSFDYQLDNGSAYRFGTMSFTFAGGAATFEDNYTETGTSLGGNLYINNAGYLSCSVTTAATLKYNLKQYF